MKKGIELAPVFAVVLVFAALVCGLTMGTALPALADEEDDATTHIEIDDSGVTITDDEGTRKVTYGEAIGVEKVGDDMVRIGSDVHVPENTVLEGDAVAIMGNVRVDGYVEGDAVAVGGDLIIGPEGHVDGDGVSVGGVVEKEGGVIRGETVSIGFGKGWKGPGFVMGSIFSAPRRFFLLILWLIVVILLGALLMAIVRRPVEIVSDRVRKEAFFNGLIGLLGWALLVPIIVLLVITIIGIPIAVLVPFVFIVMLLLGFIGVSHAVGLKFTNGGNGSAYKAMAIGVVLLYGLVVIGSLLKLGPGPAHFAGSILGFVGWAIVFVASTVGLGAVITSKFGTKPKQPKVAPPETPPATPPLAPQTGRAA